MKRLFVSSALAFGILVFALVFAVNPVFAAQSQRSDVNNTYAALGDSVAAGFGLRQSSSDPADVACARSTQSYPHDVAAALQMPLDHLACTGASTNQGLYGSQQVTQSLTLAPQIDQAFAHGTPRLMTITIGANDVQWNNFITKCYVTGCGSTQDNIQFEALLLQLRVRLFVALADIRMHSGNNSTPRVLLTGYYAVVSNDQPHCSDTDGLTSAAISWINDKEVELNNVIRQATIPFPFVQFLPVNFTGHEFCSYEPWVQGLTAPAPFHPIAIGQAAIAQSILSAYGKN